MDRNGDGQINNGRELFGSGTLLADGSRAANGFLAMRELDLNFDQRLDQGDAAFKDLRIWVDGNSDGRSDAGELKTLDELGITALNLQAQSGTVMDQGNLLGLVSSYESADGRSHDMADVWFAKASDSAGGANSVQALPQLVDLLSSPSDRL